MTATASYERPDSLDEAVELLASDAEGTDVIAGGSDLMVQARDGRRPLRPRLVSVDRLDTLRGVHADLTQVTIGAVTTYAAIESSPVVADRLSAFADAAALVGSPAIRNVGTLGGNICNASPAMDLGSPLLVHEAQAELRSAGGSRTLPIETLLVGPGRTRLAPDELVTQIHMPAPPDVSGSAYVRLGYRRAMEIAVVGAAALVTLESDGHCGAARVALTAVGERCRRVREAERLLTGSALTDDVVDMVATICADASSPIDDVRGSAAYRRAMVSVIVTRAVQAAATRARANQAGTP